MISTALALVSVALVLVPQKEAATSAERRWPLGLRLQQVAQVPRANRLGTRDGWIGGDGSVSFVVKADQGTLTIEIGRSDGYTSNWVNLWLTEKSLLAKAGNWSCTGGWLDPHLAGSACVVTDGTTATLEFEVYYPAEAAYGDAYFGRVDLGQPGAELAKRISAPEPAESTWILESHRHRNHSRGVEVETSGNVDGFGRRQGVWLTRDVQRASLMLEMGWCDGRPHGAYLERDNGSVLSSLGSFRLGFRDGQSVVSYRSGERWVDEWVDGREHGTWIRYALDGHKREEFRFEHGQPVGHSSVWASAGASVEMRWHPFASRAPLRSDAAFRAELAEFHTRR